MGLAAMLFGLIGCGAKKLTTGQPELSTELYGMVKGGKGSGVVGGPLGGVQVTAQVGEKVAGPAMSDPSGSFTLDVYALFPPGVEKSQAALRQMQPLPIDLKFEKQGFKTQVETVSFPVARYEEFTFHLQGEGE